MKLKCPFVDGSFSFEACTKKRKLTDLVISDSEESSDNDELATVARQMNMGKR
jgi:hypothetical protein